MEKDFWNANLYDEKHGFVSNYGNELIDLLNPQKDEKILDLGCGTGDLANVISGSGAKVVGIDASKNMVEQAKAKFPQIDFNVVDASRLPYDNEFDAVFSNAVLHWIKTPIVVAEGMYRSLKPGGRMVVEFGGAGNVKTITDALIKQIQKAGILFTEEQFPWYFPTIGEYTSLLESVGFHVNYAVHFSRPTKLSGEQGLKNWLEMFSPSLFKNVKLNKKEQIFSATIHNLRTKLYNQEDWYADYKRIRIVAVKDN